jgi:PAS domain S-box-containing protein
MTVHVGLSSPSLSEDREKVITLILGYDLLHLRDLKEEFLSTLSAENNQFPGKFWHGDWGVVLILSEVYLTGDATVVSDVCVMSSLSESTTRRSLKKLESWGVVYRTVDELDGRRQFVSLKAPFNQVVDRFVSKCTEDFKDLIDLNDKRKRDNAMDQIKEKEAQLRLITNSVPAMISYIDRDHIYRFNNRAYEKWFDQTVDSVNGRHVRDVLGDTVYKNILPHINSAFNGKQVKFQTEIPHKDGSLRMVSVNYVPDFSEKGDVRGYFVLVNDISGL